MVFLLCGFDARLIKMLIFKHKVEKDGLVETRIEKKFVVSGPDDDFDHDKV